MGATKKLLRFERLCNLKMERTELEDRIHSVELIDATPNDRDKSVRNLVKWRERLFEIELELMNL